MSQFFNAKLQERGHVPAVQIYYTERSRSNPFPALTFTNQILMIFSWF